MPAFSSDPYLALKFVITSFVNTHPVNSKNDLVESTFDGSQKLAKMSEVDEHSHRVARPLHSKDEPAPVCIIHLIAKYTSLLRAPCVMMRDVAIT